MVLSASTTTTPGWSPGQLRSDVAQQPNHRSSNALSQPTRASIVRLLADRKRPMRTDDLAAHLGLHANGVRLHLDRLRAAGLVERRIVPGPRGRPRHEWALTAEAVTGREPATAYRDLATWLARGAPRVDSALTAVELAGVDIGREIGGNARSETDSESATEHLHAALHGFGFAPAVSTPTEHRTRFTLHHCPYRDAVVENATAVCTLHRGITKGLLDRLAPTGSLAAFVPNDPDQAGCQIDVAWAEPPHLETTTGK